MTKTSETIVFFGSGPVAAESLRLLSKNFHIEAVITKPRPAHHRGDVPVLIAATQLKLPVFTATNKAGLDKLFATHPVKSRLGVLIDFGIIVSQEVIDYFPLGIVNSHFSLLPEWRGADPITFSILSGQKITGVSLMLLAAGMDEGPLLAQAECLIEPRTTTPELTKELIKLSDAMLEAMLPLYIDGEAQVAPQLAVSISPAIQPTYSRKLTKDDGVLDFSKPAGQLEREIRAFSGWPKSRTTLPGGAEIVITRAHTADATGERGKHIIWDKLPAIYTENGLLVIDRLKPAGKPEMTGQAFLAGYKTSFLGQDSLRRPRDLKN
jgi:methionyl-tRNA formyltransferase